VAARALVIGYGNPLRGDDGVGWHAARRLASLLREEDAEVLACHQLNLEIAEQISQASLTIFIDARWGGAPGKVLFQPVKPDPLSACAFSHHLAPSALLACAQGLYGTCPEAVLISVDGAFFGYEEGLSPPVLSALPALLDRVQELAARRTEAFRGEESGRYAQARR